MEDEREKINQSICELGRSNQELKDDLAKVRLSLEKK